MNTDFVGGKENGGRMLHMGENAPPFKPGSREPICAWRRRRATPELASKSLQCARDWQDLVKHARRTTTHTAD
jgi:hypothetical protein